MRMYLHQLWLHRTLVPLAWYKQAGGAMSHPMDDWILKQGPLWCLMMADTPPTMPLLPPRGSQIHSETFVQAQVWVKTCERLTLYFTSAVLCFPGIQKYTAFNIIQLSETPVFQITTASILISFNVYSSDCRCVSILSTLFMAMTKN